MRYKVSDICDIQSGVLIRGDSLSRDGEYIYLNIRDFDDNGNLCQPLTFASAEVSPKFHVSPDDLLLSVKTKFHAYRIPHGLPQTAIPSTSFVVLKPKKDNVLTDYLQWFFNHSATQSVFNEWIGMRSKTPYISLDQLKSMNVEIPTLEKQKHIIHLNKLQQTEREINLKILSLKDQYIQTLLLKIAQS